MMGNERFALGCISPRNPTVFLGCPRENRLNVLLVEGWENDLDSTRGQLGLVAVVICLPDLILS